MILNLSDILKVIKIEGLFFKGVFVYSGDVVREWRYHNISKAEVIEILLRYKNEEEIKEFVNS